MTIQYTTNYGIAWADDQTALKDLGVVTQQVAASLDAAMGRAGYVPPDATTFAALNAKVNALQARIDAAYWQNIFNATTYSYPLTGTPTAMTSLSSTIAVPAGQMLEVEFSAPDVTTSASADSWFQLKIGSTTIVDSAHFKTGTAPLRLRGSYRNTGTTSAAQAVSVTGWGAGSVTAVNGPVVLRFRLL